jgi:hypothetical protein
MDCRPAEAAYEPSVQAVRREDLGMAPEVELCAGPALLHVGPEAVAQAGDVLMGLPSRHGLVAAADRGACKGLGLEGPLRPFRSAG